jgi:hypothetical protein
MRANGDGGTKVIFTLLSPTEIRAMKLAKRNRLSQYAGREPLLSLHGGATAVECSIRNNGILFDLELSLAWKGLTRNSVDFKSIGVIPTFIVYLTSF